MSDEELNQLLYYVGEMVANSKRVTDNMQEWSKLDHTRWILAAWWVKLEALSAAAVQH